MIPARFYSHFAFDPFLNMAIDETLFRIALDTPGYVALRLYTWRPGAITFGLNQRRDRAVDQAALGDTTLIRRVTGGRALYHDGSELTYAVVVNTDGPDDARLGGSVAQSSARIAEALTGFLARLGTESQYLRHTVQADKRPSFFHTAPCFASVARHEIVAGQRKVVASAQRRIGPALLQHGSIKIDGVAYHPALDGPVCPENRRSDLHPLTAQKFREYATVFAGEVGKALGLEIVVSELSETERAIAAVRRGTVEKFSEQRRDMIKHDMVDASL